MEIGRGRALTLLFVISLALRCLALAAVVRSEVPLLYDESSYFDRALALRDLLVAYSRSECPADELWNRAYGRGHWPPLHAILLAGGLVIGGSTVAAARCVSVLLSALTTPLVFRLGLALSTRRAAWAAAGIHLLYPTFIAYSHYLWSETTAIFCFLLALHLAIQAGEADRPRRRLQLAAGAGAACGLGALARAALLPCVLVVPVWLAARGGSRRSRAATSAAALIAGLIVLLPWQALAASQAGRFVPLTTLGGYNLALGNNPWVPAGYGSSWGHETSKTRLRAELVEIASRESISWEAAGYILAREEVLAHPVVFLRRAMERLQMLWAPDFFPLRHLFNAIYPPMPPSLVGFLSLLSVTAYLVLLTLSVCGLLSPAGLAHRSLIIALLVTGMLLPALTLGISRLHLPLLALLLPAAGHGLCMLLPPAQARARRVAILGTLAILPVTVATVPRLVALYLVPSSYYAPVIDRFPGVDVTYSDRLVLRWSGGPASALRMRLLTPQTQWSDGNRERHWAVGPGAADLALTVWSRTDRPWELEVAATAGGRAVRLRPVTGSAWRTWQPTGIPGLEVQWAGGGPSPH